MKLLSLLLFALVVTSTNGCAPKKKKKAATNVEVPPDSPIPTVPTPPPQEPPTTPKPGEPNPGPTPGTPSNPIPTPTPTPTPVPDVPGQPNPVPMPNPIPLDPRGTPIIPRTPVVVVPHVILNTGVVFVYSGVTKLSSSICRDTNINAYYVPCANSGLYCWAPQCGYFVCQRWSFGW